MKVRYCAECGCSLEEGCDYYKVLDNFLQTKFFERNQDNIFCSKECLCDALSVESFTFEAGNGDDCEYENEDDEDDSWSDPDAYDYEQ